MQVKVYRDAPSADRDDKHEEGEIVQLTPLNHTTHGGQGIVTTMAVVRVGDKLVQKPIEALRVLPYAEPEQMTEPTQHPLPDAKPEPTPEPAKAVKPVAKPVVKPAAKPK